LLPEYYHKYANITCRCYQDTLDEVYKNKNIYGISIDGLITSIDGLGDIKELRINHNHKISEINIPSLVKLSSISTSIVNINTLINLRHLVFRETNHLIDITMLTNLVTLDCSC
jgi:hypothetical protein